MKKLIKSTLIMLLMLPMSFFAQQTVSGTVTERGTGLPVPGVNIIVKGTTNGTTTDFDGRYSLSNITPNDILVFSFLGFLSQEVQHGGRTTIDIQLDESQAALDEVVVIGYGTVQKSDATGAVTSVTPKDFNKGAVVSADQLIQGKVAGIQVTNGGGSPGEGARIRIRSGSSLNANNDPLYVIDGVPADIGGISGGRNPLASINQNDIESINILKDASATAIYGVRASNGVVIITTKRGATGATKINYNSSYAFSTIQETSDVLSASQFRDYVTANGNEAQIGILGASDTNWQDQIYQDAFGTDQNVSASGGKDFYTFRASAGYSNYEGILKRDKFERVTLSAAITMKFLEDHLRIDLNSNSSINENNYSNRGAIGAAVYFDPTQPVFVDDQTFGGYFRWRQANGNLNPLGPANPLALINQTTNLGKAFRNIGNVKVDYKLHFLPELTTTLNLGYDNSVGRNYGSEDPEFTNPDQPGSTYDNRDEKRNKLMDAYINYNKNLEAINTVFDFTGGYNYQDFRYPSTSIRDNGAGVFVEVSTETRLNLQSYFGRANFTHNDKYLLTLSLRRDGTSRFTKENRWGNFPAAAIAWKLQEENFLKDNNFVNEFKLRASWGITGQQSVGDLYPSVPLYQTGTSTASYQFGDRFVQTLRPQPYNPNLVWEETETVNLGLDFAFFNRRFEGSIDAYEKNTDDLIVFTNNPQGVGFSNADDYNIGSMKNRGLEFAANVFPVRNRELTWRLGGNITFQQSEITKLTLVTDPNYTGIDVGGIAGGTGNTVQNHQVGFRPYSFYVYEQAYGANGRILDGVYVDRNKDGIINSSDKYRYKNPESDIYYGFNTDLTYKNFSFNMVWRGSWGNYNYNNVFSGSGFGDNILRFSTFLNNASTNLLDTNFRNAQYLSDYYIQDASFVKLDNATISYTLEDFLMKNTFLTVSATGQNLLTITDYEGLDPETFGIDNNIYPRPRTFTLGLNLNF